ncbi:MAG: DUF2760 domain-containing protein [Methylococcaceae bacterium]
MPIDIHLIPTTLDLFHLVLLGLAVVLAILQLVLLSFVAMALLRKKPTPIPAVLIPEPAPPPSRPVRAEPITETVMVKQATPDSALQLLGLLQKEARFLDFVRENIKPYSDAEIGVVARSVHQGCQKVLNEHFTLEPIRSEAENTRMTLPKGYDAASIRISGRIVGEAPFTGTLIHRGWKATGVTLPRVAEGHDVHIIAQAEVEL